MRTPLGDEHVAYSNNSTAARVPPHRKCPHVFDGGNHIRRCHLLVQSEPAQRARDFDVQQVRRVPMLRSQDSVRDPLADITESISISAMAEASMTIIRCHALCEWPPSRTRPILRACGP